MCHHDTRFTSFNLFCDVILWRFPLLSNSRQPMNNGRPASLYQIFLIKKTHVFKYTVSTKWKFNLLDTKKMCNIISGRLIRPSCGTKLGGTEFESRSGGMFVIEVVHIYILQTVQRPGVCRAVYDTVFYKKPISHSCCWPSQWEVISMLRSVHLALSAFPFTTIHCWGWFRHFR